MNISIDKYIEQRDTEQLHSLPAQRLIEKLSFLKNRKENSHKRWFWELLQNASDYNTSVAVRLTVTSDQVIFEHDGTPFSVDDVLNMISPDSNKRDDEHHADNIGKFGSGLVSTHILSSEISVEGLCKIEGEYRRFKVVLDRSSFLNKKSLIDAITVAKGAFKESLEETQLEPGFQTRFVYHLGKTLPSLPVVSSDDVDLNYLYEVLPYTLCFMPKVREVTIIDNRHGESVVKISRIQGKSDDKTIVIERDGKKETLSFAYFEYNGLSSVYQYANNTVLSFPDGISRLFCGLPLIGTEEIGLPFLLNSLKFEPTTEREGVEIEPGSNDSNRKLFDDSFELYRMILSRVAKEQLHGAYNLAKMRRKYNGTQASNTQFLVRYVSEYKKILLSSPVVFAESGDMVPFTHICLPFANSKSDQKLFELASFVKAASLPQRAEYEHWFDATDFTLFQDQKYTCETLIKDIENAGNIHAFAKPVKDVHTWMIDCLSYIRDVDRYAFSKHKLLPNQEGVLCLCTLPLFVDNGLPDSLKEIYDDLYAAKNQKIGQILLDKAYNSLDVLNQECRLEDLCRYIDTELAELYTKYQGNTAALTGPLNKLYTWVSTAAASKEDLAAWFRWYYPKRATLIVDMLNEVQREQALTIAQSGKMEVLAELAKSDMTPEEIALLKANISRLPDLLGLLSSQVDDISYANPKNGDRGERIVHEDLMKKYPFSQGYKVIWSSKECGEPRFDFEVCKGNKTVCYCDAKTTMRGIANADSIPFFMRKSQWEFLQTLDHSIPYYIARVFMADGDQIKYMRISKKE